MNSAAASLPAPLSPFEQLREGRQVIRMEADALAHLSQTLDTEFCRALDLIVDCRGSVIVTGMGKAGLVGRKIAATLSSTGTRAHVLHPAEAVHGDLGCVHGDDVVLALSHSGETEEVCRLLPLFRRLEVPVIAVTASDTSQLGSEADVVIRIGRLQEAGLHGLAPSVSTTVMLAVGDALALVASRRRGFSASQFALFHPGGSLGQRLRTVQETMRGLDRIRLAAESATVREVFRSVQVAGRRTGAVMLTDAEGRLTGLFTDSDLARLFSQHVSPPLDDPIRTVMTASPITVGPDALLSEAVEILSNRKVSELPVVDDAGRPLGLIDITDVIALMPQERED